MIKINLAPEEYDKLIRNIDPLCRFFYTEVKEDNLVVSPTLLVSKEEMCFVKQEEKKNA